MIETTNRDVGIKVYDEFNQEVDVNGGRMETDMGTRSRLGVETGEFNFLLRRRARRELGLSRERLPRLPPLRWKLKLIRQRLFMTAVVILRF